MDILDADGIGGMIVDRGAFRLSCHDSTVRILDIGHISEVDIKRHACMRHEVPSRERCHTMRHVRDVPAVRIKLGGQLITNLLRKNRPCTWLNIEIHPRAHMMILKVLSEVVIFGIVDVVLGGRWRKAESLLKKEIRSGTHRYIRPARSFRIPESPELPPLELNVVIPLG